jgi:hypothetical protein
MKILVFDPVELAVALDGVIFPTPLNNAITIIPHRQVRPAFTP